MENIQHLFKHIVKDQDHIIMEDTMAIFPWYTSNAELHSTILEQHQVKYVPKSPLTIVKRSLDFYGSDLNGRLRSASKILKGQRMLPVLISELHKSCMIPLCSQMNPECVWISYRHILDIIPKCKQSIVILSTIKRSNST